MAGGAGGGLGEVTQSMVISLRKKEKKSGPLLRFVTGKAQRHAIVLGGRGLLVLSAADGIGRGVGSPAEAGALGFEKERKSRTLAIQRLSPPFRHPTGHMHSGLGTRTCGFLNPSTIHLKGTASIMRVKVLLRASSSWAVLPASISS